MTAFVIKILNALRKLRARLRPQWAREIRNEIARIACRQHIRTFERHRLRELQKQMGNQNPYPIKGVAANLRAIRLANEIINEIK